MRTMLVLLVAGVLAVAGVRLLLGTAQRQACGTDGATALLLSVQALGAQPSATECLTLAAAAPTPPPTPAPPATSTPPPATTTPPPTPLEAATSACDMAGEGADPDNPEQTEAANRAWKACMRDHGIPNP